MEKGHGHPENSDMWAMGTFSRRATPCLSFPRSRWILQVAAAVSVEPAAISVTRRNCRRGGSGAVCLRARLCFRGRSRAPSAPPGLAVDLRYNVSLEERVPGSRAAFDSGARRLLQRRAELRLGGQSCARVPFHVLDTSDYLRPLSLSLSWALGAAAGSVLDEAAPTSLRKLEPSSVKLECSALGGHRRRCSVGYPVFRSQAK
ncbi:integrin alpha-10-like, partial [Pyrgilauda ruficollis]|uniref:integrin alpha-10-like n=1 Tax=Pyrgilauda ruficollis TaxID=221976 RepID=UPI001B86B4E9